MITVHRLNKTELVINASQIETIESTPDTVITLINEKKFIVSESLDEVVNNVIKYHRTIFQSAFSGFRSEGEKQ